MRLRSNPHLWISGERAGLGAAGLGVCCSTIQRRPCLPPPPPRFYPACVDANDLRPEQARAVIDGTAPTRDYLTKLVARMDELAWKSSDPAYVAAVRARDGLRELQAGL